MKTAFDLDIFNTNRARVGGWLLSARPAGLTDAQFLRLLKRAEDSPLRAIEVKMERDGIARSVRALRAGAKAFNAYSRAIAAQIRAAAKAAEHHAR